MRLDNYHPIAMFSYFMSVIFLTMFVQNPIIIVLSFLGSVLMCFSMFPAVEMAKSLCGSLFIILLMTIINPLLVHRGVTELLFINSQPITLEAILYGLFMSTMLVAVYYWFKAYNKIMSSDKFIYLFSRFTPKISLMLSMSLSFIPKLKKDYRMIKDSQQAMGIYIGDNYVDKVKSGLRISNIMFNMAVEGSVERAESMQARGYGLKGRTSFNIYRMKSSDSLYLVITLSLIIAIITLLALNFGRFSYYPSITAITLDVGNILLYVFCFLLYSYGVIECIKESIIWKISVSKI